MATLDEEYQRRQAAALDSRSVAAGYGARGWIDNVLSMPSAVSEISSIPLSGLSAGIEGAASAATGGEFDFLRRYSENQQQFPSNLLRNIPRPTVQGIEAVASGVGAMMPGGNTPIGAAAAALYESNTRDKLVRGEHPIATKVGDTAGDIASILGARIPVLGRIANFEHKIVPKYDVFFGGAKSAIAANPGLRRAADRVVNSPTMRRLGRGVFRAGETGFEAAVLEAMQGDDPLASAGFAAGAQLAGSGSLAVIEGLRSGGPAKAGIKLTLAAAGVMGLTQVLKEATPGGRDRILESAESGFAKVALTLGLGAASAMLGAGRLRGTQISEDFPMIIDAIATIPRGASLSILTRWNDGNDEEKITIENALNKLSQDSSYEGISEIERQIIQSLRDYDPLTEEYERRNAQ